MNLLKLTDHISQSGAATDSFLIVILVAGVLCIAATIFGVLAWKVEGGKDTAWIRNRPMVIPATLFVIGLIFTNILMPLPISPYKGPNVISTRIIEDRSLEFEVRDIAYEPIIEITASTSVNENETCFLYFEFRVNNDLRYSSSLEFTYSDSGPVTQSSFLSNVTPKLYVIEIYFEIYSGGVLQNGVSRQFNVEISQVLTSNHLEELASWDTYKFIFIIASFLMIIVGICVDLEDMKKYRYNVRRNRGTIYAPRK
jgi:hypothetical protein